MTIDAIEETIGAAFPQYRIYRAWTSKMILAKIEKRDHIHYDNVKEAMERMAQDGIEEVIVQPTHVMNGVENDLMKADVLAAANHFPVCEIRQSAAYHRRRQCICGKNNYRCISCNSG